MLAKRTRDADDKIMRKKNSRLRFKKLVLAILLNKQWLDDSEEQGIVMNAKKNVALLIRQKRKTGLLTVAVSIYDLRYTILLTIFDLRYSIYGIRLTIFNLRYSEYNIRNMIFDLQYSINDIRFTIFYL